MKRTPVITKECGLCKLVMEGSDSPDLCGFCGDITVALEEGSSSSATVAAHDPATNPDCDDCMACDKTWSWPVWYDVTIDGKTLALCRLCALFRSHGEVPSPPEVTGQLALFVS